MSKELERMIDESKRLDEAATKGPWEAVEDRSGRGKVTDGTSWLHIVAAHGEDLKFIAHARTALPALVAEVERLNRVVDQAVAFSGLVILPMREHDVPSMSLPEGIRCHRCQLRGTDEHPDLYAELKARESQPCQPENKS